MNEPVTSKSFHYPRRLRRLAAAAVCVIVAAFYCWNSQYDSSGCGLPPEQNQYNLLVQGLRNGQLSLKEAVPPGLVRLANPWDPAQNQAYRLEPYNLYDQTYYHGKLYLYFGIAPALILFLPWAVLTGRYLSHEPAVIIFCVAGFLTSAGLLRGICRRYFPDLKTGVFLIGLVALGLADGVPILVKQAGLWQVPISCAYALVMASLCAVWRGLHEPSRRARWVAAASLAYGLALGSCPNLLPGAAMLLVPGIACWREREGRNRLRLLAAATVPVAVCGVLLLYYNYRRFGDPFEFGLRLQLGTADQSGLVWFRPAYFLPNLQMYFLRGIHGSASFPYLFSGPIPASLAGRAQVETCFGILTATPVAWLALGAPFAWSGHPDRRPLRIFALAVALLFAGAALPILLYFNTAVRYEVDFLPELILLAVLGILGLEGTLARWPATRRIVRWGWGLLLAVSVSFNVVSSTTSNAMMRVAIGDGLVRRGDPVDAMIQYQNALRLFPGFAEAHRGMGDALLATGHAQDSISDFEAVLRLAPESAVGHDRLAEALFRTGRISEALDQCEQAVRLDPADAVYRSHRDFLRSSLPQR